MRPFLSRIQVMDSNPRPSESRGKWGHGSMKWVQVTFTLSWTASWALEGLDADEIKTQFLSPTADSCVPGRGVSSSCTATCTSWSGSEILGKSAHGGFQALASSRGLTHLGLLTSWPPDTTSSGKGRRYPVLFQALLECPATTQVVYSPGEWRRTGYTCSLCGEHLLHDFMICFVKLCTVMTFCDWLSVKIINSRH